MENLAVERKQVKKSIWFDVEAPVTSFVPRHDLLASIAEKIMTRIVVISGLAGMGKSELARKYAQDHREDYNGNVIWINASSPETIRESFIRLASGSLKISLRNQDKEDKPLRLIVKEVYEYFSSDRSLFIFDSAEMLCLVETFLPQNLSSAV
jgi:predicted ATP-dependent serine protease